MYFAGLMFPQFMMVFFKNYGIEKIEDDQFLTITGSVSSLFSAAASLFFGYFTDKFPFKPVAVLMYAIILGTSMILPFMSSLKPIFLLSNLVAQGGIGGASALFPAELTSKFGNSIGGQLSGIIHTANVIALSLIIGIAYVLNKMIHYDGLVIVFGLCTMVSLSLAIRHQKPCKV